MTDLELIEKLEVEIAKKDEEIENLKRDNNRKDASIFRKKSIDDRKAEEIKKLNDANQTLQVTLRESLATQNSLVEKVMELRRTIGDLKEAKYYIEEEQKRLKESHIALGDRYRETLNNLKVTGEMLTETSQTLSEEIKQLEAQNSLLRLTLKDVL